MAIDQNKVTIAISRDDPKWNWLLKYHKEVNEDENELLASVIYQLDNQLEKAQFLLGEVIKLPDHETVPYNVKKRIFTYLTREEM